MEILAKILGLALVDVPRGPDDRASVAVALGGQLGPTKPMLCGHHADTHSPPTSVKTEDLERKASIDSSYSLLKRQVRRTQMDSNRQSQTFGASGSS